MHTDQSAQRSALSRSRWKGRAHSARPRCSGLVGSPFGLKCASRALRCAQTPCRINSSKLLKAHSCYLISNLKVMIKQLNQISIGFRNPHCIAGIDWTHDEHSSSLEINISHKNALSAVRQPSCVHRNVSEAWEGVCVVPDSISQGGQSKGGTRTSSGIVHPST